MGFITQFYTWVDGNTITAARSNGNISNIIDGLSDGTKDVNLFNIQIAGNTIVDENKNLINIGNITSLSSTDNNPLWKLISTNDNANSAELEFYKFSSTPADNDDLGRISFYGDDDGTNKTLFAQILVESSDVTDTTEDGKFTISTMVGGSSQNSFIIDGGNIILSGTLTGVTSLTVDNLIVNGNDISSSSGNITLTPFAGNSVVIDGGASFDGGVVTGITDLTSTNITGTLQTAAQANITSLGTLTTLTVDNVIINGTTIGHTSDTDLITLTDQTVTVAGTVSATTLTGTLSTAAQTNVTSLGTLSSVTVSGVSSFSDGSAAAPSITNTGDTNTGLYFPSADTVGIVTGGVDRVRVDSSGNIMIGSTTINSTYSPKIQITSTENDTTGGLLISSYKPSLSFFDISGGAPAVHQINSDSGTLSFVADSNQDGTFDINTMSMDSSGKVFMPSLNTTTSGANARIDPSTGEILRDTSSLKYKDNVADINTKNNEGYFINTANLWKLNPVTFWSKKDGRFDFGLIAEHTFDAVPELVACVDGKPESINYDRISVLLLAEMKKLRDRVAALESR